MSHSPSLLIAQITDTHLFATDDAMMLGCVTANTFAAVVQRLEQLQPQPDLLLLTGDLSQDETPESYQRLRDRLAPLNIPTYWIPGNHDVLPLMEQWLATPPFSTQKCFQQGGWNFILLTTAKPGHAEGFLSIETLNWLEQQLQQNSTPTLIVLHHHPLPIQSAFMDGISLQQPEAFFSVIDRFPQVKLVVFGHIHQAFAAEHKGVFYLGTPSTCVQLQPQADQLVIDSHPPGFRLLNLFADGTYSTTIERVQTGS